MSVVVIGMEMPESCETCKMNTKDAFGGLGCRVKNLIPLRKQNEAVPNWCPLRPLPEKHGRLVDADDYIEMMQKECDESAVLDKIILKVCMGGIKNMQTIVEAEGRNDE